MSSFANTIPIKNVLYKLLPSHIIIQDIDKIMEQFYNYLSKYSIKWIKNNYVYDCSYFNKQDFLRFRIYVTKRIIDQDNEYIMEFKLLSGDRFAFAELLYSISDYLKVSIPGSNQISILDDEFDFINYKQNIEFMSELISKKSSSDLRLQCLQNYNSCLTSLLKIDENFKSINKTNTLPNIFNDCPTCMKIIYDIITMMELNDYNFLSYEEKLYSISILTNIYNIYYIGPNSDQMDKIKLSIERIICNIFNKENIDYHLQHIGLELAIAYIKYTMETLPSFIFDRIENDLINGKFNNNIPAKELAEEFSSYVSGYKIIIKD